MLIVPIRIETPITKWPITNIALIVITTIFFFLVVFGNIPFDIVQDMVLHDWNVMGIFGSLFLHGGLMHLVGNMIFLWIFGNAICGAIGNKFYLPVYFFLGFCGSALHLLLSGQPAIGASGAINGIVGMTLWFFPRNKVKIFYWIYFRFGTFHIRNYWLVLMWFLLDILGIIIGGDNIGHWAHLGGFLAGVSLAALLDFKEVVTSYECTLRDVFTGNIGKTEISDGRLLNQLEVTASSEAVLSGSAFIANDSLENEYRLQQQYQQYNYPLWNQPGQSEAFDRPEQAQTYDAIQNPVSVAAPVQYQTRNLAPKPSSSIKPAFRILRCVGKDGVATFYVVNEGDPVSDLSITSNHGISGEIIPKEKIDHNDAGAIKFTGCKPNVDFRFQLHFVENGEKFYQEFSFSFADRKFHPV